MNKKSRSKDSRNFSRLEKKRSRKSGGAVDGGMETTRLPMKPFISYVGSKSKLLQHVEKHLPKTEIHRYFEPFVGGGSVLFYVGGKPEMRGKPFYINDLERRVVDIYMCLKHDSKQFKDLLTWLDNHKSKQDFLNMVSVYNQEGKTFTKCDRSALYLYLLKLSYNNNLKYDKNKMVKPTYSAKNAHGNLFDSDNIENVSRFLKSVHMYSEDYLKFFSRFDFKKGDFVFLDPPYSVELVGQYYSSVFSEKNYEDLLHICEKLDKKGAKWLLTLNAHKSHSLLFKKFKIHRVRRHSFISNGLNKDTEIFITNY